MNPMTCAHCGHQGHDVSTRIVEVNATSTIRIASVTGEYRVPERFVAEPRCMDTDSCRERAEEDQPA